MGWNIYRFGEKGQGSEEFKEAYEMAREGLDRMCELAGEMESQYGERSGHREGYRDGYRDEGYYGERRGHRR